MRTLWIVMTALLVAASATSAADLTGCHQNVAAGSLGVLQNDIDCTGAQFGRWGVVLEPGAKLDLNGHSITGGFGGVWCQGKCSIQGPGSIENTSVSGAFLYGKARVKNVDIANCGGGIEPHDFGDTSISIKAKGVTITGSGSGISAQKVKATDVAVSDSAFGIRGDKVRGKRVTVTGNDEIGVRCTLCKFSELVATGNGDAGLDGYGLVVLRDSTLTGNDGLGLGIDVIGRTGPPILIDTVCGRSGLSDGSDWDVCADDE
jgi:hypothetical protein